MVPWGRYSNTLYTKERDLEIFRISKGHPRGPSTPRGWTHAPWEALWMRPQETALGSNHDWTHAPWMGPHLMVEAIFTVSQNPEPRPTNTGHRSIYAPWSGSREWVLTPNFDRLLTLFGNAIRLNTYFLKHIRV